VARVKNLRVGLIAPPTPETADCGVAAFVCNDEAEMSARLADVGDPDRRACRIAAERRFSTRRIVDDRVALYRQLLNVGPAAAPVDEHAPVPASGREG
jgi:hypothetical protein